MQQICPINYLAYFKIYQFPSIFEVQFFDDNSALTQNKMLDELMEKRDEMNFALQMP